MDEQLIVWFDMMLINTAWVSRGVLWFGGGKLEKKRNVPLFRGLK